MKLKFKRLFCPALALACILVGAQSSIAQEEACDEICDRFHPDVEQQMTTLRDPNGELAPVGYFYDRASFVSEHKTYQFTHEVSSLGAYLYKDRTQIFNECFKARFKSCIFTNYEMSFHPLTPVTKNNPKTQGCLCASFIGYCPES